MLNIEYLTCDHLEVQAHVSIENTLSISLHELEDFSWLDISWSTYMYLSGCVGESYMQTHVTVTPNLTSPRYMLPLHFPSLSSFLWLSSEPSVAFYSYDKLMSHNWTPEIETTK